MSFSAKPDDPQSPRKRTVPDAPQSRRHGTAHRVARRPGTGDRRPQMPDAVSEATGARVIYLSWADTFGRPARAWLPGMIADVLPFRQRQPATGCP